jgi:hypothetical protein
VAREGGNPIRFGPRDRRGLIAGFTTAQVTTVSVALFCAVCCLRFASGPDRLVIAGATTVVGALGAALPVGGRTLIEWGPTAARFVASALTGSRRSASIPTAVTRTSRVAAVFADFTVIEIDGDRNGAIGALVDRSTRRMTGVLSLAGDAFSLLTDEERTQRVGAWAAVLAAAANNTDTVVQLKWMERTVPDPSEALRARVSALLESAESRADVRAARRSYADFVKAETTGMLRHEMLLAVSVQTRSRRAPQRPGGARRDEPFGAALANEIALLEQRCRDAGIVVEGALSAAGIRKALWRSFASDGVIGTVFEPWPLAVEDTWSALRTDGTWHATYWVAEWPRNDVGNGFLLPLLLATGERRSVVVAMVPVPPRRAVRAAEHARTSTAADADLRRRHGFALTARARSEHDAVVRREIELAEGHAAYRFSGYVTVTAADRNELERSCARIEQASALAHLEIRRLYGMQGAAFGFTIPNGRGCS